MAFIKNGDASFGIGDLVTCTVGKTVFNAEIIGVRLQTPQYIIRDYLDRELALGEDEISSHHVPVKYKGIKNWRFMDACFVSAYDGVAREKPKKIKEMCKWCML